MAAKKKTAKKKATKKKAVRRTGADSPPKASEKFKPGRWHVNQQDAAEFCGVRVQVFQRRGIPPAGRHGRSTWYDLREIAKWERDRDRKKGFEEGQRARPEGLDTIAEDTALAELDWTRQKAEGQRLKNAEMRRELARIEMIAWSLGSLASQVSAILGTLPAKIKRSMPKLSSDEIRIIKSEIVKAQNACAKECELDWDEFPD